MTMGKFINPFTDFGFKRIFGQEMSKDLLIDFLNSLLQGERRILSITFMDKEQPRTQKDGRTLIYDIYCETDSGESIIVEMQNRAQISFIDRMLYYSAQAICRQGERGQQWMYDIKAVYAIAFMNFRMDNLSKLRTDVTLADMETGRQISNKLRMIFLQLPLFDKRHPDECETNFERWIYVLNNMEVLNRMPYTAKSAVFKKLEDITSLANMSREEQMKYDHALKVYRDNLMFEQEYKDGLKKALEEGKEKGREEGRLEGREEGRLEGREEGRLEGREEGRLKGREEGRLEGREEGRLEGKEEGRIEVAKEMIRSGMQVELVAKIAGLTVEAVKKLKV